MGKRIEIWKSVRHGGGQAHARASQKASFAKKRDMLAALAAKVDLEAEANMEEDRASDDVSYADDDA